MKISSGQSNYNQTQASSSKISEGTQRFQAYSKIVSAGTRFGITVNQFGASQARSVLKEGAKVNQQVARIIDILV